MHGNVIIAPKDTWIFTCHFDISTALKEAFYLFDYDKDGKIAASELGVIIRSVALNPTERLLKEITNEVISKSAYLSVEILY